MTATTQTIKNISELLNIAQLAIDLVQAQKAIVRAKDAYYVRLREFSCEEDGFNERIDPRSEDSEEIIAHSKDAYAAYKASKRKAYNITRRLHAACNKVSA